MAQLPYFATIPVAWEHPTTVLSIPQNPLGENALDLHSLPTISWELQLAKPAVTLPAPRNSLKNIEEQCTELLWSAIGVPNSRAVGASNRLCIASMIVLRALLPPGRVWDLRLEQYIDQRCSAWANHTQKVVKRCAKEFQGGKYNVLANLGSWRHNVFGGTNPDKWNGNFADAVEITIKSIGAGLREYGYTDTDDWKMSMLENFLADVAKQRLLIGNDGKLEQKKKRKRMPREKGSRKKQAVERDVSGHQEGEDAPEGRQDPYNEDIHISQVIPIQRNNRRTSNLEDCYNEPESQGDSEFGRFEIAECPIIEPNEQKVTQTDNNNKGGQGAGNEEFAAVTSLLQLRDHSWNGI